MIRVLQPIRVVNSELKLLKYCDFITLCAKSYAITAAKQLAMHVVATGVVVDAIAIADLEAILGAILPDRALHEPRKRRREGRVELPSIDMGREDTDDAGAPSRLVTPVAVRMVGAQPPQDPSPVQEIMECTSRAARVMKVRRPEWDEHPSSPMIRNARLNQTMILSAVIGPPRSDRTTCPDSTEIWRQAERASARSV
jgi:hypothetical protein